MSKKSNPFEQDFEGFSCFDDLMQRINGIQNYFPPELKIIFISFHQEFISNFTQLAKIFYSGRISINKNFISEKNLLNPKIHETLLNEESTEVLIFDDVSSPETLGLIIQLMEKGRSIHVFCQWEYSKNERRSSFSILLRNCIKHSHSSSISEVSMWSSHISKRFKQINVVETLEFT